MLNKYHSVYNYTWLISPIDTIEVPHYITYNDLQYWVDIQPDEIS